MVGLAHTNCPDILSFVMLIIYCSGWKKPYDFRNCLVRMVLSADGNTETHRNWRQCLVNFAGRIFWEVQPCAQGCTAYELWDWNWCCMTGVWVGSQRFMDSRDRHLKDDSSPFQLQVSLWTEPLQSSKGLFNCSPICTPTLLI